MSGSAIKPHLVNLSGSGPELAHAVVERDLEPAHAAYAGASGVGPSAHVLVVHAGTSTNLTWSADGRTRRERFHRGQALVNPAGLAARPRWERDVELMLVAFEPAWLEKLAEEAGHRGQLEITPRYHLTDPFLATLVERLVLEYEQTGPADPLYAQSLLQATAAHVVRVAAARDGGPGGVDERAAGPGLPPRRLAHVVDYIHAHLGGRLTLADLAGVAGVSESHFARVFRSSTGHSPHQYVLRLRLERARKALLTTDDPIARIADACGFADQSHLTRTMRRHLGLTPRALRTAGRV
ncbi:AraC family transcriptional regulator [Streptomyces alkaliterrae]|uniref:Helix-turn-helix domain-containing protein n=1 Tax=Streptomyces alkaliterrae TaxID=2213162 RepID=A0A5P0YU16_9ACTN|nr:AraC family transcriptional regulator [Streptomyces alkaliterrae]MBB1256083.1 helix-turn-helix transcriptional regulator [Streptomyces alkaliterrae]MBB1261999.1 helix-turn-helix transcriptional regulator [Streptomyces alkaliterrae]MQS03768.1 helix-turn-helix domain-containing protein [Streptomyces alkaliterrae]